MSRKLVIVLPDDAWPDRDADYIRMVAQQVEDGYLSGHIDTEHQWEFL